VAQGRLTFGARGNYAWTSSDTPFFLRPFVVLRGVPAVRYQGDQAVSGESELRWQFHERWSAVAFGGAGATRTDRRRDVLRQSVGSGGAGFRYELARKFGLNAGIDIAHSPACRSSHDHNRRRAGEVLRKRPALISASRLIGPASYASRINRIGGKIANCLYA